MFLAFRFDLFSAEVLDDNSIVANRFESPQTIKLELSSSDSEVSLALTLVKLSYHCLTGLNNYVFVQLEMFW